MDTDPAAEEILKFWLGEPRPGAGVPKEISQRWWKKDPDFDAEIRERFGDLLRRALRGELEGWKETPRGRLALVILLDQLTRNCHRGSAEAFAGDAMARELVQEAIERGDDGKLGLVERYFLYMPLMHAEDREAQDQCVERFHRLAADAPVDRRGMFQGGVDFAIRHRDIVARFGRFPHRNAVLGRDSTDEETAFLSEPGSSF